MRSRVPEYHGLARDEVARRIHDEVVQFLLDAKRNDEHEFSLNPSC